MILTRMILTRSLTLPALLTHVGTSIGLVIAHFNIRGELS